MVVMIIIVDRIIVRKGNMGNEVYECPRVNDHFYDYLALDSTYTYIKTVYI